MEVILKKDIEHLGFIDDIVNVKAGYARNYLIPNKLAIFASVSEKKILEENLKQREQKNQKIIEDLESVKNKIETLDLKISSKVGEDKKLFGSVTSATLESVLQQHDIVVEKKYIIMDGSSIIKNTGDFSATIRLHRGLTAKLSFKVIAE